MSNQRFFNIESFRFPTFVLKNCIYSFLKQNSLSNPNIFFQISKFLIQKQVICFDSNFLAYKKFCFDFRNMWTKSIYFGLIYKFLD